MDMDKTELKKGDIVQVNPEISHKWGGFFILVDEPKSFGCQGILMSPFEFEAVKLKGVAFVRVKFEDIELVGRCEWILNLDDRFFEAEEQPELVTEYGGTMRCITSDVTNVNMAEELNRLEKEKKEF
jgi:hypothetical protein